MLLHNFFWYPLQLKLFLSFFYSYITLKELYFVLSNNSFQLQLIFFVAFFFVKTSNKKSPCFFIWPLFCLQIVVQVNVRVKNSESINFFVFLEKDVLKLDITVVWLFWVLFSNKLNANNISSQSYLTQFLQFRLSNSLNIFDILH